MIDPQILSQIAQLGLHMARRKSEVGKMIDLVREVWTERAAIREYLGGLPRDRAELYALTDAAESLGLT